MTTPTGQISMSDVRLEIYGSATGQIDMEDPKVYALAGKTAPAAISMSDLKGKAYVVYTPASGSTLSQTKIYPNNCQVTITCNKTATWTYSLTLGGTNSSVSIPSGGTGTSIIFSLTSSSTNAQETKWTVSATCEGVVGSFTVDLSTQTLA